MTMYERLYRPITDEVIRELQKRIRVGSHITVRTYKGSNLGNFDDVRAESMIKSAKIALEHHIPCILDLVGVACSPLRMQYAKKLLLEAKTTVIKGNISECKAFYGLTSHAHGVDADILDVEDVYESAKWLMDLSRSTGCIVVCSLQSGC